MVAKSSCPDKNLNDRRYATNARRASGFRRLKIHRHRVQAQDRMSLKDFASDQRMNERAGTSGRGDFRKNLKVVIIRMSR